MKHLAGVVLVLSFLSGCATSPWKKYPIRVPPDYSCFYGGAEGGTRYYIWKCLDGRKVVIRQSSFGFWQTSADKYEASCAAETEIESKQYLGIGQKECKGKGHWKIGQ